MPLAKNCKTENATDLTEEYKNLIIETEKAYEPHRVTSFVSDEAPGNVVAKANLKEMFPALITCRCFAHAANLVGKDTYQCRVTKIIDIVSNVAIKSRKQEFARILENQVNLAYNKPKVIGFKLKKSSCNKMELLI